jgi:hypothetical protein
LNSLSAADTPRVGPIAPPVMNVWTWVAPPSSSNGGGLAPFMVSSLDTPTPTTTSPHWVAVTGPGFASTGQTPGEQQSSNASITGADPQPARGVVAAQSQEQQQAGRSSPTISLVQLVPPGVPVGTPITIKNPLPQALPIDLHKPVLPQVLPPPLVLLLMGVAQQVPFAGWVITPLMNAVVPPFLADVVIPALLPEIVAPTLSLGAALPDTTIPRAVSFADPALFRLQGSGTLPRDLAPMGMDVPQAPSPGPPPPLTPEPPTPPTSPDNVLSPLSQQVEFRAGYSDYLRNAGMAQIVAIAVPGAVAILLFAVGGGFIGYRQARAGHVIRAEGIGRFLR